ncbi:hypothetical protein C8R47DRAFT_1077117 [Mycena vitilis]|nr:hypothetical protein C8R47DRAFT_1077117 [Mycena vitilis]
MSAQPTQSASSKASSPSSFSFALLSSISLLQLLTKRVFAGSCSFVLRQPASQNPVLPASQDLTRRTTGGLRPRPSTDTLASSAFEPTEVITEPVSSARPDTSQARVTVDPGILNRPRVRARNPLEEPVAKPKGKGKSKAALPAPDAVDSPPSPKKKPQARRGRGRPRKGGGKKESACCCEAANRSVRGALAHPRVKVPIPGTQTRPESADVAAPAAKRAAGTKKRPAAEPSGVEASAPPPPKKNKAAPQEPAADVPETQKKKRKTAASEAVVPPKSSLKRKAAAADLDDGDATPAPAPPPRKTKKSVAAADSNPEKRVAKKAKVAARPPSPVEQEAAVEDKDPDLSAPEEFPVPDERSAALKLAAKKAGKVKSVAVIGPDGASDTKALMLKERRDAKNDTLQELTEALKDSPNNNVFDRKEYLGLAVVGVALDHDNGSGPLLVTKGQYQRDLVPFQVGVLEKMGLRGLQRNTLEHALTVAVDRDTLEVEALCQTVNPGEAGFPRIRWRAGAYEKSMHLIAGQHRIAAFRKLLAPLLAQYASLQKAIKENKPGTKAHHDKVEALAELERNLQGASGTWLVVIYSTEIFSPKSDGSLLLQLSSNNKLPAYRDTPQHHLTSVLRSLRAPEEMEALQVIASGFTGKVGDLVSRHPDVVRLFAELYRVPAFHDSGLAAKDLLDARVVIFGALHAYLQPAWAVMLWLASRQSLPGNPAYVRKPGHTDEQNDAAELAHITAWAEAARIHLEGLFQWDPITLTPQFKHSQRVLNVLVNGAESLYVAHLAKKEDHFAVDDSVNWQSSVENYWEDLIRTAPNWKPLEGDKPFTANDVEIMAKLEWKLEILQTHSYLFCDFPFFPTHSLPFPLLCPSFVTGLIQEQTAVAPLFGLVAHWFVPGLADVLEQRVRNSTTIGKPAYLKLSQTELVFSTLLYFQGEKNDTEGWATTTPAEMGARTLKSGKSYRAEVGSAFYKLVSQVMKHRATTVIETLPAIAKNLTFKALPRESGGLGNIPEDLEPSVLNQWTKLMAEWSSLASPLLGTNALPNRKGSAKGQREEADLRRLQKCPPHLAASFPPLACQFLSRTYFNWMLDRSGSKNTPAMQKRFAKSMHRELLATQDRLIPLTQGSTELRFMRQEVLNTVREAYGLDLFNYWYIIPAPKRTLPARLPRLGDAGPSARWRAVLDHQEISQFDAKWASMFAFLNKPAVCGIAEYEYSEATNATTEVARRIHPGLERDLYNAYSTSRNAFLDMQFLLRPRTGYLFTTWDPLDLDEDPIDWDALPGAHGFQFAEPQQLNEYALVQLDSKGPAAKLYIPFPEPSPPSSPSPSAADAVAVPRTLANLAAPRIEGTLNDGEIARAPADPPASPSSAAPGDAPDFLATAMHDAHEEKRVPGDSESSSSEEDGPVRTRRKTPHPVSSSDDDDQPEPAQPVPPRTLKPRRAAKAPAPPPASSDEDDEDDEAEVAPPRPRRRASGKAPAVALPSSSESEKPDSTLENEDEDESGNEQRKKSEYFDLSAVEDNEEEEVRSGDEEEQDGSDEEDEEDGSGEEDKESKPPFSPVV